MEGHPVRFDIASPTGNSYQPMYWRRVMSPSSGSNTALRILDPEVEGTVLYQTAGN